MNAWIERDGDLPLDAFVDSIPFNETRRYLRRVYRSWRVYRLLYPRFELAAPAIAPTPPTSQPEANGDRY